MRHERSGGLTRLYEWALPNLHQPLTVDQLAQQAGLSQRTVIRRFNADTGQPPMRWLLEARLSHARELLESTDLTVEGVARWCGLGTPANFRALFKEHVGVPPSVYRDTFHPARGRDPGRPPGAHEAQGGPELSRLRRDVLARDRSEPAA